MGKKAILFIIIGVIVGVALAGGGVYFMLQNGAIKPEEEEVVEVFDLKNGQRLTLEKVQIPLKQTSSKMKILQANFTIVFKTEEARTLGESMEPDIRDAIFSIFESKTAEELNQTSKDSFKEPILEAIRNLYNEEEDRENIVAVQIPAFMAVEI